MNLTLENCADFVRSSMPEAVREEVRALYMAETEAKEALWQKVAAYFAGKDQYFQRIVGQIEKVRELRQDVEAEKAQHSRALVEATLSGDSVVIQRVQGELARCEAERASLNGQIEMFTAYELTGDPALYEEITQDHCALLDLISSNSAIRDAMYTETEKIKSSWACAVYNPDTYGKWVSGNYREPWQSDFEKVQVDQQTTPETVGTKLNAKTAAAPTAAAAETTRQRSTAAPGAVFLPVQ